jgi:sigma-B regulation protein RsbU (phosphoserine phosphatase)
MSTPPSKHSNNNLEDYAKYGELLDFHRILNSQDSYKDQIITFTSILQASIACQIKIWFSESAIKATEIQENTLTPLISPSLTPLMDEAYSQMRTVTNQKSEIANDKLAKIIAIPLLIEDSVWAVIQVEKKNPGGFFESEMRLVEDLAFLLSININQLKQKKHTIELQIESEHLFSISQINQSLLSNLDQESLLNSAVSLLYQQFNFLKVTIYTASDDSNNRFNLIGRSANGLEIQNLLVNQNSSTALTDCIANKEIVVVNDFQKNDRFPQPYKEKNIQSELLIPFLHGDRLQGILELCGDQANIFTPAIINQYQLVATTISVAMRNARLFRSEFLGRHIRERLHEVIGKLSVELSFDDVLAHLLEEIQKFIEYEASAIWLVDNTADNSEDDLHINSYHLAAQNINIIISADDEQDRPDETKYLYGESVVNNDTANQLFTVHSWTAEVIEAKEIMIRESGAAYEPLGALLGFNQDYSAIGIPLITRSQVIGCAVLIHHLAEQYDADAISQASIIGDYASIAIENARLYSAAHDQAWMSTVLLQVAEATQSITNIDELLDTTVAILPSLIGVDACAIFLWDPSAEAFINSRSSGFDDKQSNFLEEWDISSSIDNLVDSLRESKIPIVLNSETIPEHIAKNIFEDYDLERDLLILFPLTTQTSLCGALLVDFTHSSLEINSSQDIWDEKYSLIQGAAQQLAIAIENLQLIKLQEEEAYISVALLQVAQAIVSLSDLDEILGTVVRITPILVGVKRCIIYLWDAIAHEYKQSQYFGFSKSELEVIGTEIKPNEFQFIDVIHLSDQVIYHLLGIDNSPGAWKKILLEECFAIEESNVMAERELKINIDARFLNTRERLLIGFPISIKGENLGVRVVEEEDHIKGSPSQHIREKRIEIVKGINQQAAIAIKNELLQKEAVKSEIMERELQLACEIQSAFLPEEIPQIPGWDFAVRWQPARQVGGDFYDILRLDEDRYGFVIADVADKGMPAALFMTLIRTLIRAAAKDKLSPSSVLKQVNELMIPDSKNGMFVTVFYGVLSLSTGEFIYANCGHNPPILKHTQDAKLIELTRTGMALGIFSDIDIEERKVKLNKDDWLVMYTDGVTEAFSADEIMFGTERLFQVLLSHDFISSKSLLDDIENAVNEFIRGSDLSDDMTLTAILRNQG